MRGKETELDKTILEAVRDPLTHLVRNSIDHGIEAPDVRVQRGKPAQGTLSMRSFHESGQVIIEIRDDGAGIDPVKLRDKAVSKGLLDRESAARLSDHEAVNLIFTPGFSTADGVTNVSGRGVGMDVVRTNIEKIGGAIDLTSEVGEGTTVRIRIPLTLAIIPAAGGGCCGEQVRDPAGEPAGAGAPGRRAGRDRDRERARLTGLPAAGPVAAAGALREQLACPSSSARRRTSWC